MEPLFAKQSGWRRLYLDLPGMGQTPGKEPIKSTDDILDVIVDFIDAVIPEQQFLLAGVSYGGYLSQGVLHRKFEQVADEAFLQKISQRYSCSFDVGKLPQPFARPVVLLTGRQDHIAGYRDAWSLLENYPRGTFAVLDRAGHNVQIEQPQIFQALVGEWLDRVRESMQ